VAEQACHPGHSRLVDREQLIREHAASEVLRAQFRALRESGHPDAAGVVSILRAGDPKAAAQALADEYGSEFARNRQLRELKLQFHDLPVPDPDADSTQFEAAVRQGVALACQQYEDEVLALTAAAVEDDRQLRARRREAQTWQVQIPTLNNSPASRRHLLGTNRYKYNLNLFDHGDVTPEPDSTRVTTEGNRIGRKPRRRIIAPRAARRSTRR